MKKKKAPSGAEGIAGTVLNGCPTGPTGPASGVPAVYGYRDEGSVIAV